MRKGIGRELRGGVDGREGKKSRLRGWAKVVGWRDRWTERCLELY